MSDDGWKARLCGLLTRHAMLLYGYQPSNRKPVKFCLCRTRARYDR